MRALVTGANGHLGFNLVQALLARGDRVRAGVRSVADVDKCEALHALPGVEVVGADLGQPAQLRASMDGIDTLFHVAAVYATTEPGRDAEILRAAIEGTESSLRAARDANVRRVVMTSSMVTLPLTAPGAPPATEADWTDDLRITYFRAKVESERLAWQLARELRLDLVTVLPGGLIGPGFRRNTPSIDIVQAALMGEFRFGVPVGNSPFIDVRDVVDVHLRVADRAIGGRFIAGPDVAPSFRQLVETLRRIDPRVQRPLMTLPRLAAPMLPLYDALSHRFFGTPRIATPEVIGSAVSGKVWNGSSARAKVPDRPVAALCAAGQPMPARWAFRSPWGRCRQSGPGDDLADVACPAGFAGTNAPVHLLLEVVVDADLHPRRAARRFAMAGIRRPSPLRSASRGRRCTGSRTIPPRLRRCWRRGASRRRKAGRPRGRTWSSPVPRRACEGQRYIGCGYSPPVAGLRLMSRPRPQAFVRWF